MANADFPSTPLPFAGGGADAPNLRLSLRPLGTLRPAFRNLFKFQFIEQCNFGA
jgi:hypothetical protein